MKNDLDFNLDWLLGIDYTQPINFLIIAFMLLAGIFLRYLILALVYHELAYKKLGEYQPFRRLHQQIKIRQVKKEVWYSFLGAVIFAVSGTVLLISWQQGCTKLYTEIRVMDLRSDF